MARIFRASTTARMVIEMLQKTCSKKICLFYILILFLWGAVSSTTSALEMADCLCDAQECYVNHSSTIQPLGKTFPSQAFLSARNFGAQETVSAARGRNIKPLSRSVRNTTAVLFTGIVFSGIFVFSVHIVGREILSHCLCGMIITNYLHRQDGQKDRSLSISLPQNI